MKSWGKIATGLAAGLVAAFADPAAASRITTTTPAPAASPEVAAVPVVVARYGFDLAGPGATADNSGHGHVLMPSFGQGGRVRLVDRDAGRAAAFPPKCTGWRCPHAVLQAASTPELNPGAGPIRYGASVQLTRGQTGSGENILQKGYSASGGQYKLQVDGAAGRPSCVLSDDVVRGIHVAQSGASVADGAWHVLECRRSGGTLTLLVDGAVHATTAIPPRLAVANTVPLSVGGKGGGPDNDQFHGVLDDVWIALG
jgi:hypothetical protein